jgi:hypothetical protein
MATLYFDIGSQVLPLSPTALLSPTLTLTRSISLSVGQALILRSLLSK